MVIAAALLFGELVGHGLQVDSRWAQVEQQRLKAEEELRAQEREERTKMLEMLFPAGSELAAGVVAKLVPPELMSSGLTFDEFK